MPHTKRKGAYAWRLEEAVLGQELAKLPLAYLYCPEYPLW